MNDYSNLKSIYDFQKFIDDNNINSKSVFYKNYPSVYNKFRKIVPTKERGNLKFKITTNNDYSNFNTLEDFQNFINKNQIKSNKDFVKNWGSLYSRYLSVVPKNERGLKFPQTDNKPFTNIKDFQLYIDKNNIKSLKSFRIDYKTMYKKFLDFRKSSNIKYSLVFPEESKSFKYNGLNTNEDFQNYINEHKIESKADFRNDKSLSSRYYRVVPKSERNLVFKKESSHHYYKDELSSVEDFQEFIENNNIHRPVDFKNMFPKEYDRFCRVIPREDKHLLIYKSDLEHRQGKSYGERFLIKLFEDNNMSVISEKTFPDLKNISYLRYDIFLPEYNTLVEYHGEQHFDKSTLYSSDSLIENDKIKYEYAINNKIHILYFTLHKRSLINFGYFTEVLTDSKILIQRIKDFGMTNQN